MIVGLATTGCTSTPKTTGSIQTTKPLQTSTPGKVTYNYTTEDRTCLKWQMYFDRSRIATAIWRSAASC